ncbi:MAG: sulfotransferase [Phycisphaera sp.]|nr:sulfotransferase [Phycisphaera sp.]
MERQISRLATESGRRVFIEKTPQHVMRLPVILRSFPNARIVHITRDGRDGFCSAQSHRNVPQRRSISVFGRYWRKCVRAGLSFDQDPRLLRIRYEDLSTDPEQTLRTLVTGLGLEWDPQQLDPMRRGNDARGQRSEFARLGDAISGSRIGRWRNELDENQQQVFLEIAGEELTTLGYEH